MKFHETRLAGLTVIDADPIADNRGFFARLYCEETFKSFNLERPLNQISISYNIQVGTLRGLHIQRPPHMETKIVRVTRGSILDVAVDVRRASPTFGQWYSVELSAENRKQLYIPEGFAHGFQTLLPETEVLYHISVPYAPEASSGIRYDDPDLAIAWPETDARTLSERDRALPPLSAFEPV